MLVLSKQKNLEKSPELVTAFYLVDVFDEILLKPYSISCSGLSIMKKSRGLTLRFYQSIYRCNMYARSKSLYLLKAGGDKQNGCCKISSIVGEMLQEF